MLERRANPIGRAATANVPRISLGGLRLAVLDIEQTANFMIDMVFPERRVGRPLYLTSANGEVLARCSTEPMTGRLFRAADLINADGQPLVTVSRLKSSTPLPERVATTDLFDVVARKAAAAGLTFYMFGAQVEANAFSEEWKFAREEGIDRVDGGTATGVATVTPVIGTALNQPGSVLNNLAGWAYTAGVVKVMSDGTPWRPLTHIEDISLAALCAAEAPRDIVHNQAFNIGRNDANYQVRDIAMAVQAAFPGSVLEITGETERTSGAWFGSCGLNDRISYCGQCQVLGSISEN